MCAMSQCMWHIVAFPCLTRAIVSQLDQLADRSQYRRMNWSVLITRRIPPEGIEVLRRNDVGVVSRDNESPLQRSEPDANWPILPNPGAKAVDRRK